ncbi:SOS response-associated peptidase [Acinetobacter bouvetii]|uniref:Abasic site processing protein n=1 Tax=Acinetobacter bouvetii TaxID=202951 RepID=A0A811GE34_9GAMM|nr:SOS response-associated peptidase family protein [Acinetobacter bouvetii]CAB1221406.1 hypothetical protein SFB21_2777 [Acinetobacter bouvetii]
MCAIFETIKSNRAFLLGLCEPPFAYPEHTFPLYDAPILMHGADQPEWDLAKFGLIPFWAKELKYGRHTYNARTETVAEKPSFRHAWHKNQFALVPVETIFEPKYIEGKPHWFAIFRKDGLPFTLAAIYENAVIDNKAVRSMSLLTINADQHPFMRQFHSPNGEKRSVIVIPDDYRREWLSCKNEQAPQFFFEMKDEYIATPQKNLTEKHL